MPAPAAPLDSFSENAMNVAVQAWTLPANFSSTKDDLLRQVQQALNRDGIRFSQPLRAQAGVVAPKTSS
jgi:small-conductance mechanosensitive channel